MIKLPLSQTLPALVVSYRKLLPKFPYHDLVLAQISGCAPPLGPVLFLTHYNASSASYNIPNLCYTISENMMKYNVQTHSYSMLFIWFKISLKFTFSEMLISFSQF